MINVALYIQGQRVDLFKDEKIEINLNVKNLSDISKVLTDFSQTFSVPASPANNIIFSHWYESDVDGSFNANLRADAYIEVNSLPFRYGSIQLTDAKLEGLSPTSYQVVFFSNAVNLSDLFGDEDLSALDLSAFDHDYNEGVIDAMNSQSIGSGDLYYPLINAVNEMSIGTTGDRDLIDPDNEISYREFKPAIRILKIIEAMEQRYAITFSRDFFERAVFYNLFLWLHRDAGFMKAFGEKAVSNFTSAGSLATAGCTMDTSTDTLTYTVTTPGVFGGFKQLFVKVKAEAGFEDVPFVVYIENNSEQVSSKEGSGTVNLAYLGGGSNNIQIKVSSSATLQYKTTVILSYVDSSSYPSSTVTGVSTSPVQTITSLVKVSDQMPTMKVKDFFNTLIGMFNLVVVAKNSTEFYIDTLDNWYSKGNAYDITRLVDIKTVQVKRPSIKKLISFLYQKAGAILGAKYLDLNTVGYGDLKAQYDVQGDDLKIESKFENMLFERLPNEDTGDLTNIQAGYAIDKDLKPYKGNPFIFYRNGLEDASDALVIQPSGSLSRVFHTATEDNLVLNQVTGSLNFGADNSSYFYSPIEKGLYFNYWKTFIEDLFNSKTRILNLKCKLPAAILYQLKLNDCFVFKDKKYKISTAKIDLTTGQADVEIFTDLSSPLDSTAAIIPLTVDSTLYTVDSELLTADMVSIHQPVTSYTVNGISRTSYLSSAGQEHFEVKVSANTNWTLSKIDDGDGVGWFSSNKYTGNKNDYVRITTNDNTSGSSRTGTIHLTIGDDSYDLTLNQSA